MFTLKIFYFRYDSRAETPAKLKTDLYFVKLCYAKLFVMQKASYIKKYILADDPLPRMLKKVEFSIAEEAVSSWFLINLL